MGSSINNETLQQLAYSIPVQIIHKNFDQPSIIEAILFGQSGLLRANHTDEYPTALYREYQYQKRLHCLEGMNASSWKYARLRPASFPNIRIAQLAALVSSGKWSIELLVSINSYSAFKQLFELPIHSYWSSHYDFEKERVTPFEPSIGEANIITLYINFFVPLLFAYGKDFREVKGLTEEMGLDLDPTEMQRVAQAMSGLDEERARLIELRYMDGMSFAELGQVLRIGKDAAKMRTHRVLGQLRTYLAPRK